ncbi:serine protease Do [Endobacter medicaginis]|uniref:Serine protease Do n=3 Tax=Endobacter medicaginis TaxID=1181271 RepID=A0A839V080_9PROT|nr:trypsin-like peptidase domain-containing protein [Endobacter medicaginis]MBB3174053.1 serine protease Do [Endobacter medicaginis]MCX5476051.1 trypsin-like peptidase domain-containing protein [Endobacter medicaginis]
MSTDSGQTAPDPSHPPPHHRTHHLWPMLLGGVVVLVALGGGYLAGAGIVSFERAPPPAPDPTVAAAIGQPLSATTEQGSRELAAPAVFGEKLRRDLTAPLVRLTPPSFAPLVRRVVPSVVNIAVTEQDDDADSAKTPKIPPALKGTPFEKQFRERMKQDTDEVVGAGSGFIIDPSGIIVTNNHVVGNAERIVVSLADGTRLDATMVGSDDLTDIAVIRVHPKKPLPAVRWGDSRALQVGDWVLAAGNPFGLGSSVTAGILSARGRDIGAGPFDDFLQLDAPINPGNSGGPSFDMRGDVVALNTAIVSPTGGSVGLGFAIPSEIVAPIVAQLRLKGHIDRGWLGVTLDDPSSDDDPGVDIVSVDRDGPAAHAGLHVGDVVLAVNGTKVDTARSVIRAVAAIAPGSPISLRVSHHGHASDVPVIVGRRPEDRTD